MTYYDDISEGYDELHKEEQDRKMNIILENIEIKKDDYLLDVGCGSGLSLEYFNCKKIGIDSSKELLKKAKSEVLQGVAEDLPFEDNTFDIVICISALHNFSDPEKATSEMKRVGKNKFVITVFNKGSNKEKFETLIALIKNNFQVEKVVEDEHDNIFFCR